MKRINVIFKVTEGCNLRCKYCYNCDSQYSSDVMPEERMEKLLRLLAASYDNISLVWHGGEPMMCGLDYFRRAMEIQDQIYRETGVPISNSIQTNATLITKEWISFFKKHKFKLGVSFDGIGNEDYRQNTEQVLKVIGMLKKKKLSFGCLAVVADDDYDMIANYRFFADQGLHFALSPMFCEGGGENLPALSVDTYIRKTKELFDHWIYDEKGVNIRIFSDYVSMIFGSNTKTCTNGSCHGKWLGITPDGSLYNCGRDMMKQYCFGNIDDMTSISEAFASDGFRRLLLGAISRRSKCMESCEFFPYCESGCSDCAIIENGIDQVPGFSCQAFREIFTHVRNEVQKIIDGKVPLSRLNPSIRGVAMRCMSER